MGISDQIPLKSKRKKSQKNLGGVEFSNRWNKVFSRRMNDKTMITIEDCERGCEFQIPLGNFITELGLDELIPCPPFQNISSPSKKNDKASVAKKCAKSSPARK